MSKAVLIAGVGRDGQVGEAVARAFAATGARLALVDRTAAQAERHAAALRAAGHEAHGFGCDLADDEQVGAMVAQVHAILGDVDAVVCVAGGFAPTGPLDETAIPDIEHLLGINLRTAVLTTRATLPMLRRTRGSLVYFGSVAALPGSTGGGMAAYAIAKSGVLALMRAVAADERAHGVRANAVAPTSIRTAANVASMGDRDDYVSREEVAASVVWLCSDAATAVNGQVLRLG